MIRNTADILKAFMDEEASKLAKFKLKHGPTIGDMYEGLSAEILNRATPTNLDLRIVNGFVVDAQGHMSGQIDCMLVRGAGERIPFTDSYKWPIQDVLAVFEIKKTLTYGDLKDSFVHLRQVYDSYRVWFDSLPDDHPVEAQSALRAFAQMTGVHTRGRTDDVPAHLQLLHYTLIIEQLSPVRIVWGYGGYKTQAGLREALVRFLETAIKDMGANGGMGFGVPCFPQMISCNGISLVKSNGQPYRAQMHGEYWPFYVSSVTNPVWLMLELLWAKIENVCKVRMPYADGIIQEAFAPFLSARSMQANGQVGWYYKVKDVDLDKNFPTTTEFKPIELTLGQYHVLGYLATSGAVDTTSDDFITHAREGGRAAEEFIKEITATGLAAIDGKFLRPTTDTIHLIATADGKYFAGSITSQMLEFMCAKPGP